MEQIYKDFQKLLNFRSFMSFSCNYLSVIVNLIINQYNVS